VIDYRGTSNLAPGTVIASRYEVVKCLGTGSMGMVYACRKRGSPDSAMVAVKVLFPDVAHGDKVQATRFRKEIFATYGVDHPNVVKAWEYIRDGDIVAYSMELINGGDLGTKLGKNYSLFSIPRCIKLLGQMCAGVQAIHDAGIIHRDLKPENILLTEDGEVKIVDFGIARLDGGIPRNLTANGGVIGTIDYVAPEYLMSSQIDARADIYAVGVLGYEMITGESPFSGDTIYETLWKRVEFSAPPPSERRPECPAALDAIIKKALAIKPENRFQTALDMLTELQALSQSDSEISELPKKFTEENRYISEAENFGEIPPTPAHRHDAETRDTNLEPKLDSFQAESAKKWSKNSLSDPLKFEKRDSLQEQVEDYVTSFTDNLSQKSAHNSNAKRNPPESAFSQLEAATTRTKPYLLALRRSDLFLLLLTTAIVIGLGLVLELFEIFPIAH